jgi:hypothetical protein
VTGETATGILHGHEGDRDHPSHRHAQNQSES